jgi:hypothetical protein
LQASTVESRAAEVVACRAAIEKETLADTESVLHRLRAAESAKLSSLQADLDALRTDMAAIDRFYASLRTFQPHDSSATDEQTRSLQFMRAYPDLCAEADRLVAKPVKTVVCQLATG